MNREVLINEQNFKIEMGKLERNACEKTDGESRAKGRTWKKKRKKKSKIQMKKTKQKKPLSQGRLKEQKINNMKRERDRKRNGGWEGG